MSQKLNLHIFSYLFDGKKANDTERKEIIKINLICVCLKYDDDEQKKNCWPSCGVSDQEKYF